VFADVDNRLYTCLCGVFTGARGTLTGGESLQRCQLSNYEFTRTSAECSYKQGNYLTLYISIDFIDFSLLVVQSKWCVYLNYFVDYYCCIYF